MLKLCVYYCIPHLKSISCYRWCLSMKIIVGQFLRCGSSLCDGNDDKKVLLKPPRVCGAHRTWELSSELYDTNFWSLSRIWWHWLIPERSQVSGVWAVPECTDCRRCRSTCEKRPGVCVLPASYMKLCYCTITVSMFTSVLIFASRLSSQSLILSLLQQTLILTCDLMIYDPPNASQIAFEIYKRWIM